MNRVEISGRLTRDPEIRLLGERQFPITTLNVAVDDGESRYDRQTEQRIVGSGFYRVEVLGEYGRSLAALLMKGSQVYVVGSLGQFSVGEGDKKDTKTQIRATMVMPLMAEFVQGPTNNFGEEPF